VFYWTAAKKLVEEVNVPDQEFVLNLKRQKTNSVGHFIVGISNSSCKPPRSHPLLYSSDYLYRRTNPAMKLRIQIICYLFMGLFLAGCGAEKATQPDDEQPLKGPAAGNKPKPPAKPTKPVAPENQ
jgi:hypothetical protein